MVQIWDALPSYPEEWTETSFEGAFRRLKICSPQDRKLEKEITPITGSLAGDQPSSL